VEKTLHYSVCFLLKFYNAFTANMISRTHAAKKLTPPNGVIAPSTLIPDRLSTYKLPENKMVPININQPDHDSNELAETLPISTPTIKIPKAWNIWYSTPVFHVSIYFCDIFPSNACAPNAPNATDKKALMAPMIINVFIFPLLIFHFSFCPAPAPSSL
jgi:hypothetical protein